MKCIVAGHEAVTAAEFAELAFGIDLELFAGPAMGESEEDRAARLDVAREVLAELRETDPEAAAYAESLLRRSPLKPQPTARRSRRSSQRRQNVRCTAPQGVAA
ncbi:hypothetical protein ACGFNV_11125 [Streptomyces sp. NPDC048751]|uniref:hypothetical protein n=1 Tax=Streptomyces sp. NPDC048751 TaxID=3365591 RepID=UPI0037126C27